MLMIQEALRYHPAAAADLPAETYRRYVQGQLPKPILWLLRHPGMLRTLADLADEQSSPSPPSYLPPEK